MAEPDGVIYMLTCVVQGSEQMFGPFVCFEDARSQARGESAVVTDLSTGLPRWFGSRAT